MIGNIKNQDRAFIRLLKAMGRFERTLIEINDMRFSIRDKKDGAHIAQITLAQLKNLESRGLIHRTPGSLKVTTAAHAFLKRAMATEPFQEQHLNIFHSTINDEERPKPVRRNMDESPLTQLYFRKRPGKAGFLSQEEFEAGEQLRRDFTFGALMPSVTMNWQPKLSGKSSAGGTIGDDFTDNNMAARNRVARAMKALGPELGGVLVDCCCFLKGMEAIEKERGWPQRSAKVVVKTALAALARHYNPSNHYHHKGPTGGEAFVQQLYAKPFT